MQIQRDDSIPQADKSRKIQELMTQQWTAKHNGQSFRESHALNKLKDKKSNFDILSEIDQTTSYYVILV
jgi:hypothetical protein